MARFARIDSQIRANRLILANRFGVPELTPIFCESCFGGLKIANRRFEAIRANRSHLMKIRVFLRIDSCESIHANRPDSRFAGTQSTTLFGDHPFSIKHPQDNFGLQNLNWHPPKCKLTPSKTGLATSNLQFLYRSTQKPPLDTLYFGGRQLTFWWLKLSWGGFIEKGGPTKRVVL